MNEWMNMNMNMNEINSTQTQWKHVRVPANTENSEETRGQNNDLYSGRILSGLERGMSAGWGMDRAQRAEQNEPECENIAWKEPKIWPKETFSLPKEEESMACPNVVGRRLLCEHATAVVIWTIARFAASAGEIRDVTAVRYACNSVPCR